MVKCQWIALWLSQVGEESSRKITVADYLNGAWTPVASIALPFPSYPLARRGLETLDITGDQLVDFVVPLDAAGTHQLSVDNSRI